MFITKMALPRRTFLRGMGVTLALPLARCDGAGALRRGQDRRRPVRRLGFVYTPNGATMSRLDADGRGAGARRAVADAQPARRRSRIRSSCRPA